jgi:hypothetical protein
MTGAMPSDKNLKKYLQNIGFNINNRGFSPFLSLEFSREI